MINIEVNGQQLDGFLSVNITKSFLDLCATFSLESINNNGDTLRFKVGDKIVALIGEIPLVTGSLEQSTGTYDINTAIIQSSGRDFLGDFVDSTLSSDIRNTVFNTPIEITEIARQLLENIGLENISISSNVEIRPFDDEEIKSLSAGANGFEFLAQLCRLRQVLMTSDGLGNIEFAQASKEKLSTILLSEVGNEANNILSSSVSVDYTSRFNRYSIISQANLIAQLDFNASVSDLVNREGDTSLDEEIRTSRNLTIVGSESTTVRTMTDFALWENNIRRARSKIYSCTVEGFFATQDEDIWRPNKLVEVHDELAGVASVMLINSVSFSQTLEQTTTTLELISPDAFTPQPILTKDLSESNDLFNKFVSDTVASF